MDDEGREILSDMLRSAIPISPAPDLYVTRNEFEQALGTIETKIENAALKQKQWVLSGCIAILLAFGGGYVSLVSKIDRLTEALPAISKKQDDRAPWIQRQEQRDAMQDEALRKLDKEYRPLPYVAPPQ